MDLSDYLPLSRRPAGDEATVSSNWARPLGELLLQIADSVDAAGDTVREIRTDAPGSPTVEAVARALLVEIDRGPWWRRRTAPGSAPADVADESGARLAEALRDRATTRLSGHPRTAVGLLGRTLVDGWEIAAALHTPIEVGPAVTGAVALARSLAGPFEVRAVARARTLVASDHGWRIGHGQELVGTAEAIILFLYGRRAAD
ncbi:hypothetical protein [Galbitalea soli]|uniref:Uncharacterized protein n=1 Tax=Galbitalea soli TaxID=1268042 RepID=A0A7C9PLV0_9MICO|nr:hypothetical protein [Galbitalea soli]NEM90406.1 hypothetical protein [Galbitalea soli]NYJ31117.1 hypothetical protein [Galbitalea soli]